MFCKIAAWGEKMATRSCCIIPHTRINFQTTLTQNLFSRIISNRWTPDTPSNDGDDWTMSARGADIAIRWVCACSFFVIRNSMVSIRDEKIYRSMSVSIQATCIYLWPGFIFQACEIIEWVVPRLRCSANLAGGMYNPWRSVSVR